MALVLAVAFAARVAVVVGTPDFVPTSDARVYEMLGRSIAVDGNYPVWGRPPYRRHEVTWPPGYPAFLGAVYRLSGQSLRPVSTAEGRVLSRWEVARLVQAVVGTLAVGLIGLVGWQLWGRRVGLLALGLAAVYAPLALISATLMTEGQFVCLALGALACALAARGSRRRSVWLALSGVLVGLAALTRDTGLVLLLPLAFAAWSPPRRSWRAVRGPALLVCAALLTVAPWTVRNAIVADAFVPVSAHGGKTLAGTYNGVSQRSRAGRWTWTRPDRVPTLRPILARYPWNHDPAARDAALGRAAVRFIRRHPVAVPEAIGLNTLRMFGLGGLDKVALLDLGKPLSRLGAYWFWAIGLLALIGLLTPAARRAPLWLWAIPAVLWASVVVFNGAIRYRAPIDPFVVLAAALALDAALTRLGRTSRIDRRA